MAGGFSVTIRAVDAATGVIARVNTGLESLNRRAVVARAPFERFNRALAKFGENTGISRLASDVGGLGQKIGAASASLGRFAPALGALTSAASVAGLARLVENWTTFGSRLGFDSQRIGVTAQSLQGLQGAARLAGSSAEALTAGMTNLQDGLTNAAAGRDPQMVQTLAALGIALFDATGHARRAEQVLPELANRIAGIKDPTQQALAATLAFGAAGESLLPFLRRGAAGIADYNAQAARYGLFNEQGVAAANAMREAQTRLGMAVEGVGYAISEKVAPVLVPMLLQFSDWIAGHREDISRFFGDIATRLREWVEGGGPARLLEGLQRIGTQIEDVTKKVGGWQNALEILGGVILLKILSPLVSIIGVVGRLTAAIAVGLVEAFSAAGGAATLFNTRVMALPAFRLLATTLSIADTLQNGVPLSNLPAWQQQLLNPPAGSPQAAESGGSPSWWQLHAPTWLGGRPAATSTAPTVTPGDTRLPQPTADQGAFIERYGSMAQRIAEQTGASSRVILGQLWQETGGRGDRGNNPFNLQAGGQWNGERIQRGDTRADGTRYTTDFRAYGTLNDAADDYVRLLRNRYPGALNAGDDPRRFATGLVNGSGGYRYAEDPGYVDHVASAANRFRSPSAPNGVAPIGPAFGPQLPPLAAPVAPVPAAAGATGQSGPNGSATVRFMFDNPPAGMRASTVAQGGLRIEQPTLGNVP